MKVGDLKYAAFRFANRPYRVKAVFKTYSSTSSGWKTQPDEVEERMMTAWEYESYINSIPFFNSYGEGASCRAKWWHCMAGYLPLRVTSISPNRITKIVVEFEILEKEKDHAKD